MRPVCLSSCQPYQSVQQSIPCCHVCLSYGHICLLHTTSISLSINQSVSRTVCPYHSQSVHHPSPSVTQPVHPPSHQFVNDKSVCHHTPSVLQSISLTVRPCLTICTPSYPIHQDVLHHLTVHPPYTPVCQTVCHSLTSCMTTHPVRQIIHHCPTVCTMNQSVCQHVHHHPTV